MHAMQLTLASARTIWFHIWYTTEPPPPHRLAQ